MIDPSPSIADRAKLAADALAACDDVDGVVVILTGRTGSDRGHVHTVEPRGNPHTTASLLRLAFRLIQDSIDEETYAESEDEADTSE